MADVYKVAVALSMTSNAPAFLSALSSKLLHVHTQVKDLEGGLNRLNRIKLAVGGGLAIAGGTAALSALGKMVDKGNELVKVQQNMAQAGVKAAEVQEAYAKAWELTNKYRNVGAAEALKVINEGRMTFGSQHEATHHAEDFVKMISFLKAYQGGKHGGSAANFEAEAIAAMKSGEIAGKVTPSEMAEHVKQLTAMRVAYGDQLKIGQYLTAQRAAGVALRNTSDDFRYGMFPALVQENGPGAGVMLMTAFNKIVAGTGNRTKSLEHMAEIGLLKKDQLEYNKAGMIKGLKDPSAIMNNQQAAMNFGDWVMNTFKPLLDKKLVGLSGNERGIREAQLISAMFPDRNAAKAITEVLQQYTKLQKDAAQMRAARGALNEGAYLDKSWEGQKQAFHEQWENFVQALGAPMVGQATEALRKINDALSHMAQWASRPEMAATIEQIGHGIAALGLSLTAGGAAALLAAIGPAGWLAAGLTALVAIDFKGAQQQWEMVKRDIGLITDFAKWAGEKGSQIAAALGPLTSKFAGFMGKEGEGDAMGRLVTGLVNVFNQLDKVMYEAAQKLGDEIKSWPGKLASAIAEMGTGIVTAIGDMLKSLFARLNPFQKSSFDSGSGFGGLLQNASFSPGGSANDNFGGSSGVARALGRGGFGGAGGGFGGGDGLKGGSAFEGARTANQGEAYRAARALGLSDNAARAFVANVSGESIDNPADHHWDGKHTAEGMVQWDPFRASRIAKQFGMRPRDMSVAQQTAAAMWEIQKFYPKSWQALQGGGDPRSILGTLIQNYERPQDVRAALAHRLKLLGRFDPNAVGADASGLSVKGGLGGQAFGGGANHGALTEMAKLLQGGGGVNRFTAFNDHYHAGSRSMHARGLAMDVTGNATKIMANARAVMEVAGLAEGKDFKMINEYVSPSRRATGGHVHFEFRSREAADRFSSAYGARTGKAPTAGAPPARSKDTTVHTTINMDGRKVAHSVSRHMAEAGKYPRHAGGPDTHGSWAAPGTPRIDAA